MFIALNIVGKRHTCAPCNSFGSPQQSSGIVVQQYTTNIDSRVLKAASAGIENTVANLSMTTSSMIAEAQGQFRPNALS
jgi:hypothetical protein